MTPQLFLPCPSHPSSILLPHGIQACCPPARGACGSRQALSSAAVVQRDTRSNALAALLNLHFYRPGKRCAVGREGAVCPLVGVIWFWIIYKVCLGLSFVNNWHSVYFYWLPIQMYIPQVRSNADKIPKAGGLVFWPIHYCKLKILVYNVETLRFFSFEGVDSHFNT